MIEQIAGERFTTLEPTPLLLRCINAAQQALATALGERAEVAVGKELGLESGSTLRPSIAVCSRDPDDGQTGVPDLVVEFRTESTGRLILGPKRLAYARCHVGELWYVDPISDRVAVLHRHGGRDYAWPPTLYRLGDEIEPARFPGVRRASPA